MTKALNSEKRYFQAAEDEWQQVIHYFEAKGLWRAAIEFPFFVTALTFDCIHMAKDIYQPRIKSKK